MASSDCDDDSDPIVKEIDICLAKSLMEKLYLFQYPVRPSSLTYDNTPHLAARMKPVQQKVELELGMDISSATYCFTRGEQIAHAVDRDEAAAGETSKQKPFFPGHVMDRQTLGSVRATENIAKYAAAIYSNGVLHLTPVKGIIQLRPGFSYFDKAEENQKKAAAAVIAAEGHTSQSEDEAADAKVVQLRFAKPQHNKANKQAQQRSIQAKKEAEENWIEMEFFTQTDRRANMVRKSLYCSHEEFDAPEFILTSRDYLKILSPRDKQDIKSPAALPHGVLSLKNLKTMELVDQLKNLMVTAKVIQFSQLCSLLGTSVDAKVVIKGLSQYAMLVQGCWVVKSEVLYPKDTKSPVSGAPAEKIWPSRDYMMFCFNRKRFLTRKDIASTTKLPTEELRDVLENMGRQRPAHGWEFVLQTDIDFLQKYPETCTDQASLWKNKYKTLIKELNLNDEFPDNDFKDSDFPGLFYEVHKKPPTPRRRRSSQSTSEETGDKQNNRARHRSRSQSSQEGDTADNIKVKDEPKSPLKSPFKDAAHKNKKKLANGEKKSPKNKHVVTIQDEKSPEKEKIINKTSNNNINTSNTIIDSDDELTSPNKNNENKNIKKRKRKKKIISSDEEDADQDDELMVIDDVIINNPENRGNEVEVDEDVVMAENSTDQIFIPPKVTSKNHTGNEKPPSDIFLKELKKFCRDSIRSGSLSLAELKEVLHMRQQEAGNILCTGVTDELLIKCVHDIEAMEVPAIWDPKSSVPKERQRIFLYRHISEPYDKFRSTVIDMFSTSISLRRKDIFERFTSTLGDQPTNHTYSKLMTEFCENHGGQWYLNGTYQSLQKYPTVVDDSDDDAL